MLFQRPMKFQDLVRRVYLRRRNVNPNLIEYFGEMRLNKLTALMIEDYKIHRLQTVSNASVNRELSVLKHSYTQAILWGLVRSNPCRGIKQLKETPKDRWLTYAEEELILAHSPTWLS